MTQPLWIPAVARGLVCEGGPFTAETLVLDNFDNNYLLFEHSARLQRQRPELRVLIPTRAHSDVDVGFVDVMTRISRMKNWQIIPVDETEPISLNVAYQVRDFLTKAKVDSVAIVSPAFRSRRSSLIYRAVLGPVGISESCVPVFGERTPRNWTTTWHGIQQIGEQFLKLQYYRFYVLPFRS